MKTQPKYKPLPLPCPHPYQALIKAWADGAIIQFWDGAPYNVWRDVKHNQPTWQPDVKYRVKPTTRTQYLSMVSAKTDDTPTVYTVRDKYSEAVQDQFLKDDGAGVWNPAGVIMFTSDPKTGKVLTAEVVK